MTRRKSTFDYGKGDVQGVDTRGAGGGGGPSSSLMGSQWSKGIRPTEMPKSKWELRESQRKAQAGVAGAMPKPKLSWDEFKKKNKLKGSYAKGGFVSDFVGGFQRGQEMMDGEGKKRKKDEELFPESPGTGLYRKGGMVAGRSYAKKGC